MEEKLPTKELSGDKVNDHVQLRHETKKVELEKQQKLTLISKNAEIQYK